MQDKFGIIKHMIIAICGPSGSGKSFVIDKLKRVRYFSEKATFIKREDNFFIIELLKKIGISNLLSEYKDAVFFNRSTKSLKQQIFSFFVPFVYPFIVYLEFLADFFYYEILFRNKVLIKDRYIYDYIITFRDTLGIYNPLTAYFIERFPKPSLMFFLYINKDTAIKRNKNNVEGKITSNESFQVKITESYLKLAKKMQMIIVDNNQDVRNSLSEIKEYIDLRSKLLKVKKIAIIGLDGSGKTTIAGLLHRYTKRLNVGSKIVHFYHNSLLFRFLAWIGYYKIKDRYMGYKDLQEKSRKISIETNKKGKSFVWAMLHFSDALFQYFLAIFFYGNKIIIFDRFFYDYLVNFEFLGVEGRGVFKRWIPNVDKTFLIVCSPEMSYGRKPENTRDFFNKNYQIYVSLAKVYRMTIIDSTNKQPKDVLLDVLSKI